MAETQFQLPNSSVARHLVCAVHLASRPAALRLITQTLLVAVFFHPLAAFVLRDFCFSSFFQRAHRKISICRFRSADFQHLKPQSDPFQSRAPKVKGLGCLATSLSASRL